MSLPDAHLSAELEGHDRVVLSVQDEQGAGDVLHTVGGGREKGTGWPGRAGPPGFPNCRQQGPVREHFTMVRKGSNCQALLIQN